jgi:biotin carboxylase
MNPNPVLVITLGWEQRRLLDLLVKQDVPLVGINTNDDWPQDIPFERVIKANPRDLETILNLALEIRPRAVIFDQCDYSHFAAAMVCEKLSLPGSRLAQAQLANNKWLSRKQAENSGFRIPHFKLCSDIDEAGSAAIEIGYPVIIKPVDNGGSFGVNFVQNPDELEEAVLQAIVHSHSRLFLVEQFIGGTNIIIEGYCFPKSGYQTLALGSKTVIPDRPHIHKEVIFPGELSHEAYDRAITNNAAVVASYGFNFGMTSGEYVIDSKGQPWLIEISNRGGGVLISSDITPMVSGIDHTQQLIYDILGIERDLYAEGPGPQKAACLSYIIFEPGNIMAVEGLEQKVDKNLLAMKYWGPKNGVIDWPRNALERQGIIITTSDTPEGARTNAAEAQANIKVTYAKQ